MTRARRAWGALAPEQRLAAACALGLFLTMFLPWYSHSGFVKDHAFSESLSAWGAFSFVEAAVLLVAAGVLVLLYARSQGRAFHLPGGDGTIITVAGGWVALLIFYRTLDKPNAGGGTIVGVEWGIFVAILTALGLAYAGQRLRQAHVAEPPLPGAGPSPPAPSPPPPTVVDQRAERAARREARERERERTAATKVAPRRPPIDGGTQLSFDEQQDQDQD